VNNIWPKIIIEETDLLLNDIPFSLFPFP